jgi:hypothetical protein
MAKNFDPDILEFLKRPANLSVALEIGQYAAELRDRISSDFWSRLRDKLLAGKPPAFRKTEFVTARIGSGRWTGWALIPTFASKQPQVLSFAVEWESLDDNHDIYVGLRWKKEMPKKDRRYAEGVVADLRGVMIQNSYEAWDPWWVGGHYVLNYPNPDVFFITYNSEPASIENAISTAFWKMATDYRDSVEQINAELVKR